MRGQRFCMYSLPNGVRVRLKHFNVPFHILMVIYERSWHCSASLGADIENYTAPASEPGLKYRISVFIEEFRIALYFLFYLVLLQKGVEWSGTGHGHMS